MAAENATVAVEGDQVPAAHKAAVEPANGATVKKPRKLAKKAVDVSKKPSKLKAAASAHPSYFAMISEAIIALKERTGSSPYAIGKFIDDKHKAKLPPNFKKLLFNQIKKLAASGKLTKVKYSYKLGTSSTSRSNPSKVKVSSSAATKAKSKAKPAAPAKSNPVVAKPKSKSAIAKPKRKRASDAKSPVRPAKLAKTSVKNFTAKKATVQAKSKLSTKKPISAAGVPEPKKLKTAKSPAAKTATKRAASSTIRK